MDNKKGSNTKFLAGQKLMVGFEGKEFGYDLKFLIKVFKIGGVILFSRNISDPKQLKELCEKIQSYAKERGLPPLFIAIDQEGGKVARLKPPFTQFAGNPSMKGIKDAEKFAKITSKELRQVNINMNMAPVLDVAFEPDSIMADRAFGNDPEYVSVMGKTVIKNLQENGILAVAKHFPGIGRTTVDSHIEMPIIGDYPSILEADLIPFKAAMDENCAGIMLSHILYNKIDPLFPASISSDIVNIIRERFGYNGLVITDDLNMGAIYGRHHIETIIHEVLTSDIDIALICRNRENIEDAFKIFLRHIEYRSEFFDMAYKSVKRIMHIKQAIKF